MMKKIVLVVFLVLAGLGAYLSIKLGAFHNVEMSIIEQQSIRVVAKEHVGPYHKIGPDIEIARKALMEKNIQCTEFGAFMDDPDKVEHERLRSFVGCIVNVPADQVSTVMDPELHYREFPPAKYLRAQFEGSPALGPFKVYGAAKEKMAAEKLEMGSPIFEIYHELPDGRFINEYLFPIR